jgi:hypothetical protein
VAVLGSREPPPNFCFIVPRRQLLFQNSLNTWHYSIGLLNQSSGSIYLCSLHW